MNLDRIDRELMISQKRNFSITRHLHFNSLSFYILITQEVIGMKGDKGISCRVPMKLILY